MRMVQAKISVIVVFWNPLSMRFRAAALCRSHAKPWSWGVNWGAIRRLCRNTCVLYSKLIFCLWAPLENCTMFVKLICMHNCEVHKKDDISFPFQLRGVTSIAIFYCAMFSRESVLSVDGRGLSLYRLVSRTSISRRGTFHEEKR